MASDFDVEAPTPLTAADITVTKRSDSEDGSWPEPDETIYAYSAPKLTLEAKITGSGYTWSQVEWYTDNEQVARITDASKNAATAELVLLGTGTVNIYVRAVNGGVEDYQDGTEDAPYEDDGIYSKKVPPSPWARATPPTSASRRTRSPSGRGTT